MDFDTVECRLLTRLQRDYMVELEQLELKAEPLLAYLTHKFSLERLAKEAR